MENVGDSLVHEASAESRKLLFGLLDPGHLQLDLSPEHFAEHYQPESMLKMPFNALVNIGYIIVGCYWLSRLYGVARTKQHRVAAHPQLDAEGRKRRAESHEAKQDCLRFFVVFALMPVLYAPISFMRTVTFGYYWALLDQWMTLPWFAFVLSWLLYMELRAVPRFAPYSWLIIIVLEAVSICSYAVALLHPLGFDVLVVIHALSNMAMVLWRASKHPHAVLPCALGIVCCVGFTSMKTLDLVLPSLHQGFRVVSGHFLSKVCDFLQIHFAALFLYRSLYEVPINATLQHLKAL